MKNLIPLAYLNEACFLSLNVDDKKYQMVLKLSQDQLKDDLGKSFYDEIENQYPSLSIDNENLYEGYLKDYLSWQTYFNYLKFSQADSTPTGVRQFNDDNSSIVEDVKLYSLEKNVKRMADKYKYDMINYIKLEKEKDSTKFPLWNDCEKDYMSFAITSIDKKSDTMIKVNKSIATNE
jgi:hypothetical protein